MSRTVSILTGGTNSHTESAANANAVATDFIAQGIVGAITNTAGVAPSTGGMAVNAQGSPNTTTQITPGVAYVTGTPSGSTSQTFRLNDPDGSTITHTANVSGSTRFDWIYASIDTTKLANPASDASDVFTYVVSRSTSSATDNGTPPTYGYCIAVVTLANAFATVANANITDKRSQTGPNALGGQVKIQPNIAPASGGLATSGLLLSSTSGLGIYFGSGAPTFTAAQGSIYIRTDGSSTSTRLYVNTSGSTTWTNFTSAI